ncbi:hypothetical protein BH11PSE11_BH11PSE11_34600 [soil metagenome]
MSRFAGVIKIFLLTFFLVLFSSSAHAGSPSVFTFTKAFGAPNVALNGSTSLTFVMSLSNSGNGGGTGAIGFTDTLPAGLVVATPSALSAVTCPVGGGVITAVPGSGSVSLAGANIPMLGSCTFSVNVTGTTAGLKNNSVTTTPAYIVGGTATANASLTVGSPSGIPSLSEWAMILLAGLLGVSAMTTLRRRRW